MLAPDLMQMLNSLNDPAFCRSSRLNNVIAALFHSDPHISWAGLYYRNPSTGDYELGPFQGKPACMRIAQGKGVIGAAHYAGKALIVDDVLAFPGHIACDSASRSELVIPLYSEGKIEAVLDLDSDVFSFFAKSSEQDLAELQSLFEQLAFEKKKKLKRSSI